MSKYVLLSLIYFWRPLNVAWISSSPHRVEYDGYGSLLTMNEHLIILAQNDMKLFQIVDNPFLNHSRRCSPHYTFVKHGTDSFTDYIYSVTIGSTQEPMGNKIHFAYIDEDSRRNIFVTIVYYVIRDGMAICNESISYFYFNISRLSFDERAVIGMDPQGTRIYVVGSRDILVVDPIRRTTKMYDESDVFAVRSIEPSSEHMKIDMYPKAISVTKAHLLFIVGQYYCNYQFLAYLHVLNLTHQNRNRSEVSSRISLSDFNYGIAAVEVSRQSTISIFVDEKQKRMIIGIPYLDIVLLLKLDDIHKPEIIKIHESRQKRISFGKSVVLLPDEMYAVLAHDQSTLPWSTSQIQVYSLNDEGNETLFVYPNNQQVMPTMNLIQPPYGILSMVAYESNIALVVEAGGFLLLPSSPPGYSSSKIDNHIFYLGNYTSVPCPPGTARRTPSFGPCFICPSNTKNNGSFGSDCEPCINDSSLLCLRGASNEIDWQRVSSFDHPDFYPLSPDVTEFDDVLLHGVFMFNTSSGYCLTISPLFWVILMVGCSLLIVTGIFWCDSNKGSRYAMIKTVFTHVDVIGEGQLWSGGIISLAIMILIGFTWKITVSFSQFYPIENISQDSHPSTSCEPNLLNSKFESALQLLSTLKYEYEKPIFQLLDEQKLTLTTEFVSTQFSCQDVRMQRNMDRGQRIVTEDFNCTSEKESNILILSTLLPQHLITIQTSLIGSSFIGGLRICLNSPSKIHNENQYTVHRLNICQFLYTPNETLTTNAWISIKMTKAINITAPLTANDQIIYAGLWLATFTVNTLADALLFDQGGEHRRYLSDQVRLIIHLSESDYYMENTQEPIARRNEIMFHAVLFSSEYHTDYRSERPRNLLSLVLCLDLFGFLYLFIKLTIIPIARTLRDRYSRRCHRMDLTESELHDFVRQHVNEAINQWKVKTQIAQDVKVEIRPKTSDFTSRTISISPFDLWSLSSRKARRFRSVCTFKDGSISEPVTSFSSARE